MSFVFDYLFEVEELLLQLQLSRVVGVSSIEVLQDTEVFLKQIVLQLHDDLPFDDVVVGEGELEGEFDVGRVNCVVHVAEERYHCIRKWSFFGSEQRIEDRSGGKKRVVSEVEELSCHQQLPRLYKQVSQLFADIVANLVDRCSNQLLNV